VYIACSLDGFIARENAALDWLPGSDGSSGDEDYGYHAFYDSVDAIVMGRNTYEFVSGIEPWPYVGKRVIVLSSKYKRDETLIAEGVEGISSSPDELIQQLISENVKHLYIDGGKTIQGFLRAGAIDEMTITRVPVLIGSGIPLFGSLTGDLHFKHISTRSFENGFVQSTYAFDRN